MPASRHHLLDLLFVSDRALWPLDQGFKVHGYHAAAAAQRLGAQVGIACLEATPPDAPPRLRELLLDWPAPQAGDLRAFAHGWGARTGGALFHARCRLAHHQGLDLAQLAGVVRLVERWRPRAVVGVGMHSAMMLAGLRDLAAARRFPRIWYAADELVYFNLSCMAREPASALPRRFHTLALHAAMETCFARGLEGAIGVNPREARLLHWIAGARHAVTLRNGVDLHAFRPSTAAAPAHACEKGATGSLSASALDSRNMKRHTVGPVLPVLARAIHGDSRVTGTGRQAASGTPSIAHSEKVAGVGPTPHSLIFWGRMDFEPNIDAACWFAHKVWPRVRAAQPDAIWRIAGKNPAAAVRDLARQPGIQVLGEVPDVQPLAHASTLTILPMRCGGGIKNKLLEAAAMGRPIIASPRTVAGLEPSISRPAWRTCSSPRQWAAAITELWRDFAAASQLGASARAWVEAHHRWEHVAAGLLNWVDSGLNAQPDTTPVAHTPAARTRTAPGMRHAA